MAFLPVAWVAGRGSMVVSVYLAGMLATLLVPRRWSAFFGVAAVWAATFSIEREVLPTLAAASLATLSVGIFAWLVSRTTLGEEEPLDGDAIALGPFSSWLAVSGVLVAHGANAAHLHVVFPTLAYASTALSIGCATFALAFWIRRGRWLARLHRGEIDHLCVHKLDENRVAIVEGATHVGRPYRAGEGRILARLPIDSARRSAARAGITFVCLMACAMLAVHLAFPAGPLTHRDDLPSTPKTLPPFPAECREHPPTLRLAALAPLHVLDIQTIAERYRDVGVHVEVETPLPFEERLLDRARGQVIGEAIAHDALAAYGAREHELLVVITDRDMFLRAVDWRYAFATRERGVAVVSLARMDPHFTFSSPATYVARVGSCTAEVRARAFRMITRQTLFAACSAETVEDPRSARRRTVLGLPDLDAIDEATY
jgi:hypothetical protein